MPFCPNCGNRVDGSSAFCTECGFKLGGGASGVASDSQICQAVKDACNSVYSGYSRNSLSSDLDISARYEVYISGSNINIYVEFSVGYYGMAFKAKKIAPGAIDAMIPQIRRKVDMALSSLVLPREFNVNVTKGEPSYYSM